MPAAYMLMPDERVWGNHTIMTMVGGDAELGVAPLPAAAAGAAATYTAAAAAFGLAPLVGGEHYTGTTRDLRALFGKVEAHTSPNMAGSVPRMRASYDRSRRLVDIWRAPPIPVVCVIASGQPTHVGYLYREPWPKNMNEEPCPIRYEDGDATVPVRSGEAVCRHWQRQRKCHSPLSTAQPTMYRGKGGECVEITYLHCRAANFESIDYPKGTDQCTDLHSRILQKVYASHHLPLSPVISTCPHLNSAVALPSLTFARHCLQVPLIDLVQSMATNPRAYEPGHSPSLEQLEELTTLIAWLHNSAASRLPHEEALAAALASADLIPRPRAPAELPSWAQWFNCWGFCAGSDATSEQVSKSVEPTDGPVALLTMSVAALRTREAYEGALHALEQLTAVAQRRAHKAAVVESKDGPTQIKDAGGEPPPGTVAISEADAADGEMAHALAAVSRALAPIFRATSALGAGLDVLMSACDPVRASTTAATDAPDPGSVRAGLRREWADAQGQEATADGTVPVPSEEGPSYIVEESGNYLVEEPTTCDAGDAHASEAAMELGVQAEPQAASGTAAVWALMSRRLESGQSDGERQRRAEAEARRQRLCLLRRAIRHIEEPLHDMRSQVQWCAHHWDALARHLHEAEPLPEPTRLEASEYSSSLYGDMDGQFRPIAAWAEPSAEVLSNEQPDRDAIPTPLPVEY